MATTVRTASRTAQGGRRTQRLIALPRAAGGVIAAGVLAAAATAPAHGQRMNLESGVRLTGAASSNPELAPSGQAKGDIWFELSPYFSLVGTGAGGRLRVSGNGDLGATIRAGLRRDSDFSLRPSGSLLATLEAIDNFFFIDGRLAVQRTLDNPFAATTDPTSPVNTFTSWQAGLTPYIRGRLPGALDYEVRSDNSWTDSGQGEGLYSGRHTVSIARAPQPLGGALSFERQSLESQREGEPRLISDIARLSLRYAPIPQLAFGVRAGWQRYNYTLAANEPRTFYGVDISWRPNERTNLTGYWEDRAFGDSWQLAFTHRRPRLAFNLSSSRDLTNTPQQFLTFPALANVFALLDAALTTRFPDPIERQRAVIDIISRSQLPAELLTPTVIYDERITLQTRTTAGVVLLGRRNSLGFSIFRNRTEGVAGFSTALPVLSDTLENGTEVSFSHQLSPTSSVATTASWRRTESLLQQEATTTQTQLRIESSTQVGRRTFGTLGARYQWIDSTVTNDAREAAVFFTLNHRF
jgi:uncharacterized protein (PEP-CTERM system associated)